MVHLGDKLADFFYNELSPAEMQEATRHIEECGDCRFQLQQFQRMHVVLKSSPEWEPPRDIVFSAPERNAWYSWFDWRPFAASMAAAAFVAGIIIKLSPVVPPMPIAMPAPPPAIARAETIDYSRIIDEVRQSDRAWMISELQSRDQQIQRLRAELAYYDSFQRTVMKETLENGSAIQLLAQRTEQR